MNAISRDYLSDYLRYLNERLVGAECAALRDIEFASDDAAYATRRWTRFNNEVVMLLRERDRVVELMVSVVPPPKIVIASIVADQMYPGSQQTEAQIGRDGEQQK